MNIVVIIFKVVFSWASGWSELTFYLVWCMPRLEVWGSGLFTVKEEFSVLTRTPGTSLEKSSKMTSCYLGVNKKKKRSI